MNGQCSDDTYFDFTFMVMYICINSVRGRRGLDRIDSWISNYLCYHCLSPLLLWVWTPLKRGVLVTTLYDKVCQWLATGQWFSPGTPVSSNKTDRHDITEILLKVALNTITLTLYLITISLCLWSNSLCYQFSNNQHYNKPRQHETLLTAWYSWNIAKVGVKHQSISLSIIH